MVKKALRALHEWNRNTSEAGSKTPRRWIQMIINRERPLKGKPLNPKKPEKRVMRTLWDA